MVDFTGGTWRSLIDGSEVGAIPDSVVSRPDDDSTTSFIVDAGIEIQVKSNWPSIGARVSNNSSGTTRAYLLDADDGSLIDDVDISELSSGDAFTFKDVGLQDGEKYFITLDAEGSSYTLGFAEDEENYPYTSDDVDITDRVEDGSVKSGQIWAINDVGNVGFD